jgi:hypothetical protein
VPTSEGFRKGAQGVGLDTLSLRIKQSLWLGRKTGDGNLGQQSLEPLGKSIANISPTCLKVRVNPR